MLQSGASKDASANLIQS